MSGILYSQRLALGETQTLSFVIVHSQRKYAINLPVITFQILP